MNQSTNLVETERLREKLAHITTQHDERGRSLLAVNNRVTAAELEVDKLREKLAAQQAAIQMATVSGTEELTAIKVAEYQRGYNYGMEATTNMLATKFREGKQAGRAELEKELMEQKPICLYQKNINNLHWFAAIPEGATKLYTKPFPQQKPLSREQITSLLSDSARLPSGLEDFARAIEAAHGITGD